MSYSIKESENTQNKQGSVYHIFKDEEWNAYPFASEADTAWFKDAKFGLFLHVGISAMGKVDISWTRRTHKMPDRGNGRVSDRRYDGWADQLKFEQFDARQWAKLAKASGFRYVVIITKHHDGFHMWDTNYSEHKITNSPFARNYLQELVSAMREEGLKIGLYYSKRDWYHPDYEPVSPALAHTIQKPPYYEMNDGTSLVITDKQKRYQQYMMNTVRELMTKFGKIDVLWWDAEWNGNMFTTQMWNSEKLEQEVRAIQPHIIINNRASLPGDFDTPEGSVGFFQNKRMWETCMCLGRSWSYDGGPMKSLNTVIKQLINCICGGGNYLLSIGCKPNGSIAKKEASRLLQIGQWLNQYGESIYNTRGGIWLPTKKMGSCYRDNIVYLHLLQSKKNEVFYLPLLDNELTYFTCLTGDGITVKQLDNQLLFAVTKRSHKTVDLVVKLTMRFPVSEVHGSQL